MTVPVAVVHQPALRYNRSYLFCSDNPVYRAVEELFLQLGLDRDHYGTSQWNPLGDLIKPGQRVVIKPNFVTNRDRERLLEGEEVECASTHPSVLRPIVEYVWKALKGQGLISIVDSPIEGSDILDTLEKLGFPEFMSHIRKDCGVNVEFLDLRDFTMIRRMLIDNLRIGNRSVNVGLLLKRAVPGDPCGYTVVNLGNQSCFGKRFNNHTGLRFHRSHPRTPVPHHTPTINEYSISNTVLNADVIINVPKMKTHKKTGVTLSLKSVIGTTNRKWWLPHYQAGAPPKGDEYPVEPSLKEKLFSRLSRFPVPGDHSLILYFPEVNGGEASAGLVGQDGCWYGNDTLWRTILDMNRILLYADRFGELHEKRQRTYLTIIDGIMAGEGDGPLRPSPKCCGLLVGGFDPVATDLITAQLMGFEGKEINHISKAPPEIGCADPEQIRVLPKTDNLISCDFVRPGNWHTNLDKL